MTRIAPPPGTLRAAVWQLRPGGRIPTGGLARLADRAPGLVVLPEYFWVRPEDSGPAATADHSAEDLARLADLSREIDAVWVGGTLVERDPAGRLFNCCPVFDRGVEVARYRKRRLMPGEAAAGLSAGREAVVATVRGVRLGLLICADVLHHDSYSEMALLRPQVIAVPTNSPFRPNDSPEEKRARDEAYFVSGAGLTGAAVLKACTVGGVYGRPAQGRSLIAGRGGLLARVETEGEQEERLLVIDLPLD